MHFFRYSNQESLLEIEKKCAQPKGRDLKRPAHTTLWYFISASQRFFENIVKNKLKRNIEKAKEGHGRVKIEMFKMDYISENLTEKNSVEACFLMPGKHRSLIYGQDWVNKRLLLSQLKLKIHSWQKDTKLPNILWPSLFN